MRLSTGSGCASRQPTSKRRRAGACCEAATPGLSIFVIVPEKSGATVVKPVSTMEPAATTGEEKVEDGDSVDVVEPEVSPTTSSDSSPTSESDES